MLRPSNLNLRTIFFSLLGCLSVVMLMTSCTVPEKVMADKQAYAEDDAAYRNKYTVHFDEGEKPIRYGYHYIVSTVPEGYRVRVFQPDMKVLTEEKTFSTPNLTLEHGPYKSFWDDGSIRSQGLYQYGRKHGLWVESEPGKGKSSCGMYVDEQKEGEWIQLDTNGLIESLYNWKDNKLHGKFYLYDSTGEKLNEGIYSNDTLQGELHNQPVITRPYLKSCKDIVNGDVNTCSEASLSSIIYTNLKYPSKARDKKIEGEAMIQWDILPDGTVSNIRVPQSLCDEIEKECIRVFKLTGRWVPAFKDGKPIKYTMSLPVKFILP